MACLNLEKFIVLKTMLLPPEVVMAGLFYFLGTELSDEQLQVFALFKKFITTPFTPFFKTTIQIISNVVYIVRNKFSFFFSVFLLK